jgi:hypothetical protein
MVTNSTPNSMPATPDYLGGNRDYNSTFESARQSRYQDLDRSLANDMPGLTGRQPAIFARQAKYLADRNNLTAELDKEYDPYGQEKWKFEQAKAAVMPAGVPQGVSDNFTSFNANNEKQYAGQTAAQKTNLDADNSRRAEALSAIDQQFNQNKDYLARTSNYDPLEARRQAIADQKRQELAGQEQLGQDAARRQAQEETNWREVVQGQHGTYIPGSTRGNPNPGGAGIVTAPRSGRVTMPYYDRGDSYGQNRTRYDPTDPTGASRLTEIAGGFSGGQRGGVARSMGDYSAF